MANRAAPALVLRDGDREELVRLTRSSSIRAGLAQRARIVLLAADGVANTEIAERVGVSRPTVICLAGPLRRVEGLAGLADEPRPGRPRTVDHAAIVAATLTPPPKKLGVTHWSSRLLAPQLGIGSATVAAGLAGLRGPAVAGGDVQVLHRPRAGRQGHRRRRAVPGPAGERDRALRGREVPDPGAGPDRSRCCRCSPGCPSGAPTTTSATAPPPCSPRWRSPPARSPRLSSHGTATRSSWPSSSRSPAPTPTVELHLVMDNYAAHKHAEVQAWLAANPRIHVHFTPTSGSWLNLVEVWFGIIERQAIHRGTFGSVRDLNAKIRAFINGWNDRCHPFVWTKTADQILTKANRKKTSNTGH